MTEVAFHFNVPQCLPYACRLLRKATQAQARVTVVAPEAELQGLDTQLWSFDPGLFCPTACGMPRTMCARAHRSS